MIRKWKLIYRHISKKPTRTLKNSEIEIDDLAKSAHRLRNPDLRDPALSDTGTDVRTNLGVV